MSKEQEFKQELKGLLEKYGASIQFECSDCSDLHGVYSPEMQADLGGTTVKLNSGYCVDASDL